MINPASLLFAGTSFGLEKIFLTANYTNFREWMRREEFEQEERKGGGLGEFWMMNVRFWIGELDEEV